MAFAAIAIVALLVRCVAIAEPLGIDQSLWASAVRGMSRGQRLYLDVWEQRPPGIYWIYLAGFQLLGWTASTVAWLDILAAVATTWLLFAIARPLAGSSTGLLAASLYAVLTMPAWLFGYGGFLERSVCETFIVVCVAGAFLCAGRFRERASPALVFGAGLCAGGAVVLKPNAGLYFLAVVAWMTLYRPASISMTRRSAAGLALLASLGAAVLPVVALVWLWRLGLLREAWTAVVDFNRFYVSQGFTVGDYALDFSKAVWLRMKTDPLWLAGGIGSLVAMMELVRMRKLPPLAGMSVLWGGASALAIMVNGARLFNSYFIQAFAPLALLSAWLLICFARRSMPRRLVGLATIAMMLALLVQRGYPARVMASARADFDLLRGRIDHTTYLERFGGYETGRGYSARANEELAVYVRNRTNEDDRVFLFGINGAGLYFAADRLSAHRFLRVNFYVATDFPDPRFRLDAVTEELAASRPRYIIFERLHSPSEMGRAADALQEQPAVVQLLRGYRLEIRIEDFTLYRRID